MNLETFEDLYLHEIRDLFSAETQLCAALIHMANHAHHVELKQGFAEHLTETNHQVGRLETILADLNATAGDDNCDAMEGLIKELDKVIEKYGTLEVKDAALIACAQRMEHYEIAAYGTARTFAKHLGYGSHVQLLDQTLQEEGAADKKLTRIAEGGWLGSGLNKEAIIQ